MSLYTTSSRISSRMKDQILDMQKNLFETICETAKFREGKNKAGKSTGAASGPKCPLTPTGSAVRGWCC